MGQRHRVFLAQGQEVLLRKKGIPQGYIRAFARGGERTPGGGGGGTKGGGAGWAVRRTEEEQRSNEGENSSVM